MPRRGDDYLHRSGRTGRAGARGESIAMSSPTDFNRAASISRYLGFEFVRFTLPEFKVRFHGQPKKRSKPKASPRQQAVAETDSAKRTKPKDRWRVRKQIGKRRQPSQADGGWQPVKRRPPH